MTRWWIDEPYINLHMMDEPLSYTTSSGQKMSFQWLYKQRYSIPAPDQVPNFYSLPDVSGTRSENDAYLSEMCVFQPGEEAYYGDVMTNAVWMHNYMSHILFWNATWEECEVENYIYGGCGPMYGSGYDESGYEALVFKSDGGVDYYTDVVTNQHLNPSTMTNNPITSEELNPLYSGGYPLVGVPLPDTNGIYWGTASNGFQILYPDGSRDVYGLAYLVYNRPPYDSSAEALLTEQIDPQGRVTRIGYENPRFTNSCNGKWISDAGYFALRVRYVIDSDGRTNTFTYATNCPNFLEVTAVTDPFGRSATFSYGGCGANAGWLTSITDVVGNVSSYTYATTWRGESDPDTGWISSLTTPYGTTSFYYQDVMDTTQTSNYTARATYVTEPAGASQLFGYIHNLNGVIETSATAPSVSGWAFDNGVEGGTDTPLYYRNSFHWDRAQTANLIASGYTDLSYLPATTIGGMPIAELQKGRMRHWLLGGDGISLTETMSSERDPSPDVGGLTEGMRTWYAYTNAATDVSVTSQIGAIAQILPDTTTQYTRYSYYSTGLVSENYQSYSLAGGATGELSTSFDYTGIDLMEVTNSMGQSVRMSYTNHEVTNITDSLGQATALTWDRNSHNLTSISNYSGQTLSLAYYPSNTSGHITNISSFLESMTIDPENRVVNITDYTNALAHIVHVTATSVPDLWVTNTWDGLNRATGTGYQDGTTTSNIYTYLDQTAHKDRLGKLTYSTYDGLQHVTSVTDARNNVTQFTWCGCGALTSISNALGQITDLNYNNQELLTSADFADGSSLNWEYDLNGRMINESDGSGRSLSYTYNNQSFVTAINDTYGQVWGASLDALGRAEIATNINNVVCDNDFDLLNRVTNRVWVGGGNESFAYANNGLVAYTNQDSQWTHFGRDGAERLISGITAVQTNLFTWNGLDELASIVDGLNHTTAWNYNQYGWLLNKVNTLGTNMIVYQEDADGHVINRWMMGTNTAYQFDAVGNLTNILCPTISYTYGYDAINELTNMTDASGTTAFSYTSNGLLASEAGPWVSNVVSFSYTQGHRTALSVASPGVTSWTQSYGFDSEWRMTSIASPAGNFGYQYASGPGTLIGGITLPNGASVVNAYDTFGRMTGTALVNHWGHTLDGYVYGLDALGLRTNVTRDLGLTTNNISIGYDPVGQLTSWNGTETGGALRHNERLGYAFDAAENLHIRTNDALVQTFTVDPLNQLTNVSRTGALTVTGATPVTATNLTVNGVKAQTYGDFTFAGGTNILTNGANSFTIVAQNPYGVEATSTENLTLSNSVNLQYDANGNLISDGLRSFQYDAENELTNVWVTGQWQVGFIYDGLRRRRITKNFTWQGTKFVETNEIRCIYDGMLAIQDQDTNNNVVATYTRGLDLSMSRTGAGGIGGLLARTDSTGSYYYHADANGNVTALIDGNQNIAARAEYDAFGRFIKLSGSLANANRYWFSSKEYVPQAGIYYYGRRFYEPNFSRWLNRDPIQELGGINLYRFVGNNPINRIDPFGLTTYVWPPEYTPPGTYGPTATVVNDGSIAVLPAIPYLTDSQGLGDATLELGFLVPIADVGGAIADAALDGLGDLAKAIGDSFGHDLPKPKVSCPSTPKWKMPTQNGAPKMQRQMQQRGWTPQDITDAMENGQKFPAPNNVNPANSATRYVNPTSGQSVVVDDVTGEVLHVGGPGFKY
jgi:RHS repeat-associated protein